jgi:hypothetical protein
MMSMDPMGSITPGAMPRTTFEVVRKGGVAEDVYGEGQEEEDDDDHDEDWVDLSSVIEPSPCYYNNWTTI